MMIAHDWQTGNMTDLPAVEYHTMKALNASGAWLLVH